MNSKTEVVSVVFISGPFRMEVKKLSKNNGKLYVDNFSRIEKASGGPTEVLRSGYETSKKYFLSEKVMLRRVCQCAGRFLF